MEKIFSGSGEINIKVMILLITAIIKKIRGEIIEVNIDLIIQYLPEIEKYLPNIRDIMPEIRNYFEKRLCATDYGCVDKCEARYVDKCEPRYIDKCEPRYVDKCEPRYIDKCEPRYIDKCMPCYEPDCAINSCSIVSEYCEVCVEKPVCDKFPQCGLPKYSQCIKTGKCGEFDDRVRKIKCHLDNISNERCLSDDYMDCVDCVDCVKFDNVDFKCDNYNSYKCGKISDEDERCASEWDLCHFKQKNCKPCQYECGEFAIDEDLNVFKKKVMKKAEIIISCYKTKLLECEKEKCELEKCLERCMCQNEDLRCKLHQQSVYLEKCEDKKRDIMKNTSCCEEQLACLMKKYQQLNDEYNRKKSELEKCCCKNKNLLEELQYIASELKKCDYERSKLKEKVEQLYCALEQCKKEKSELLIIIQKLNEKLRNCECEKSNLQLLVRELKEENYRLNKKVKLLIFQNKELTKENADLKKQLGNTLATLKCLCDKYNALKERCERKHCNYY